MHAIQSEVSFFFLQNVPDMTFRSQFFLFEKAEVSFTFWKEIASA